MMATNRRKSVLWLLVALLAVSPVLGGMAELGRSAGDSGGGGKKSKLDFNPTLDFDTSPGDTPELILSTWADAINGNFGDQYTATAAGNEITIEAVGNRQLTRLNLRNTDGGFERGRVVLGEWACLKGVCNARIRETNAPAGDGEVTLTINGFGLPPILTVAESGSQLLDRIELALEAQQIPFQREAGSIVLLGANDLVWDDTDSGLTDWGIGIDDSSSVPTLSTWGMLLLTLLLATAGLFVMRRRLGRIRA